MEAWKFKIKTIEEYTTVPSLFLANRWPLSPHPQVTCTQKKQE